MAKNETCEFTIKEFLKFIIKCWPILAICLVLGGALAVYSYKQQDINYSSSASILVHDNSYEFNGTISPYVQITAILQSKEMYEKAGVDVSDIEFGNIEISERSTGVFDLKDSSANREKAMHELSVIADNAEKVISKAYDGEKQYRVTSIKKPGEPVADKTQKDKLFSSALIVAISAFVAIAVDFVAFNKKAE